MDRNAAQKPFGQLQLMIPLLCYSTENADGFSGNFSPDSVTGQH